MAARREESTPRVVSQEAQALALISLKSTRHCHVLGTRTAGWPAAPGKLRDSSLHSRPAPHDATPALATTTLWMWLRSAAVYTDR
eukprot:scaffold243536_cov15-Tisochrysis_lutea.AAC.1